MATQTTLAQTAFEQTIAQAVQKFPAERTRIERADAMIHAGLVAELGGGWWHIRSQTTDGASYLFSTNDPAGCPCEDHARHPELVCKHGWCATLIEAARERARRLEATPIPAMVAPVLAAREIRNLTIWKHRYGLESAGFTREEAARLVFVKSLVARRKLSEAV